MDSSTAQDYGRLARHLFALCRKGEYDAVDLLLWEMPEEQRMEFLRLLIETGAMYANEYHPDHSDN